MDYVHAAKTPELAGERGLAEPTRHFKCQVSRAEPGAAVYEKTAKTSSAMRSAFEWTTTSESSPLLKGVQCWRWARHAGVIWVLRLAKEL
jgi:hypothetical protein